MHCTTDSGPRACTAYDLTTPEAIALIDELAAMGVTRLAISGGEPMLRRDWRYVFTSAIQRGLRVSLRMNGSMVSESAAGDLAQIGVSSVMVGIDSRQPEVHEALCELPGLHHRAIRAVRRLVARGVRVLVNVRPTRLNWQDIGDVVALAHELGARGVCLTSYVAGSEHLRYFALEPSELRRTLNYWSRLVAEYRGRMVLTLDGCQAAGALWDSDLAAPARCGAGKLTARICPNGTVTPCLFMPAVIGSCRRRSFSDLWANSPMLEELRKPGTTLPWGCDTCAHKSLCGGCLARSHALADAPELSQPECWSPGPVSQPARNQTLTL